MVGPGKTLIGIGPIINMVLETYSRSSGLEMITFMR